MRIRDLTLDDDDELSKLSSALDSPVRRKILRMVAIQSYSIQEISQILNLAISTTSFHIKILKDAQLIKLLPSPNKNGNEKNVSQATTKITLVLGTHNSIDNNVYSLNIQLGTFTNYKIMPPCGLVGPTGSIIGELDQPSMFLSPNRMQTELLFFYKGYIEYSIPITPIINKEIMSFTFSLELCSECPNYNNNWKSDITFWINGVEICTYYSQGDYGDRPGLLTPSNWPKNSTQYGFLKKFKVDNEGTYINEKIVSSVKINDLLINKSEVITLRTGIKDTATHIGGINIFGKCFGDTPQDIVVQIAFK